jgi:hypothetical protein
MRTRRLAQVHIQLQFPNGTASVVDVAADKLGNARASIPVRYNPITRYAQAQLTITVTRLGHTDVVPDPNPITIGQAAPLGATRLRARPIYMQAWCPTDPAACTIRNNSSVVIRIDSDPHVKVSVTLSGPDGTTIPCPFNELTTTAYTDKSGVYRCRLPVAYANAQGSNNGQGSGNGQAPAITIAAQVSAANGYTQTPTPLQLSLAAH